MYCVGPFGFGLFDKSHAVRLLGLNVTVGFIPIITETGFGWFFENGGMVVVGGVG